MNAPYEFAYRIRDLESALRSCKTDLSALGCADEQALKQRVGEINRMVDVALAPSAAERDNN